MTEQQQQQYLAEWQQWEQYYQQQQYGWDPFQVRGNACFFLQGMQFTGTAALTLKLVS